MRTAPTAHQIHKNHRDKKLTTRPAGAKENAAVGKRKSAANLIVARLVYFLLDGAVAFVDWLTG